MAQWYELRVDRHSGYPQPEDGWEAQTYPTSGYCDRCGIHGPCIRPFRFRSEPPLVKKRVLQLNWVFDEFFCVAEVRSQIEHFKITGVRFGPVHIDRDGTPSRKWSHLQIAEASRPVLAKQDLSVVTCRPNNEEIDWPPQHSRRYAADYPYCGRVKYHHPKQLAVSGQALADVPDILQTQEWFGSGGSAYRVTIARERVVEASALNGWHGAVWTPLTVTGR